VKSLFITRRADEIGAEIRYYQERGYHVHTIFQVSPGMVGVYFETAPVAPQSTGPR